MKKLAALLLAAILAASVIGCGSNADVGDSVDGSSDTVGDSTATVIRPNSGLAEGYISNIMRTYWFDFTVNSAYLCDSFSGYNAAVGNKLLVVDITVTNTFGEELPMFDSDFWVEWDSDDNDAYAYPVENAESLSRDILPSEYYLTVDETTTGLLLYEVPDGYTDFVIAYLEINTDDETGDAFVVYFEPDQR